MMASALEDAEPVACDGAAVRLQVLGGNPLSVEGLTRGRPSIEAIIGRLLGTPVRVTVAGAAAAARGEPAAARSEPAAARDEPAASRDEPVAPAPSAGGAVREPAASPAPPRRVTVTGAKAERLKALRQRDPTLDSAMDSLDLELLD